MRRDLVHIRRSLLQLAQATYGVLEREIPESQGLPTNGHAVLRLLRWHGAKTPGAIASFLGVNTASIDATLREMFRLEFVKRSADSPNSGPSVFELAPLGVDAMRRIRFAQQERVEQSLACLPEVDPSVAARVFESLAYELVARSTEFGIDCAECWAIDLHTCVRVETSERCSFQQADRAHLDPDLEEGPADCPKCRSLSTPQYVELCNGVSQSHRRTSDDTGTRDCHGA